MLGQKKKLGLLGKPKGWVVKNNLKLKGGRIAGLPRSSKIRQAGSGCFCKRGDWRCQRKLRKVLYIGEKKKPKSLIVIFHGMGDDAKGNVQWSEVWAKKFPGALVVIPQAPCAH